MRFYLDEDLSDAIAVVGRERYGLDIISAHSMGMEHLTDDEQLPFAAGLRRCVVTRNAEDFVKLTKKCVLEGSPHTGVLIVPKSYRGAEFAWIAERLAYYHSMYPEDVAPYLTVYLHPPSFAH